MDREPSNGNTVRITNREIYDRLVALEKKLDQLASSLQAKGLDERLGDHEARVRALEKWMYALPVSLLVSLVTAAFTFFLRGR